MRDLKCCLLLYKSYYTATVSPAHVSNSIVIFPLKQMVLGRDAQYVCSHIGIGHGNINTNVDIGYGYRPDIFTWVHP